MAILNAYYFPDNDYSLLYPEISPVNSFRVILNKYFKTGLSLLKDDAYNSLKITQYESLYRVTDFESNCSK